MPHQRKCDLAIAFNHARSRIVERVDAISNLVRADLGDYRIGHFQRKTRPVVD
jgi:hypothetical protein